MTIPLILDEDLLALKYIAPDLDFADPERRAVLLAAGSADINAAPGSGKTTVLAAKLLLLARKWNDKNRGVCVLSHTNVARDEIQRRLSASADGTRLLAYPHFIGTIHGFVDRFLALPSLRSLGLSVDVIDDDVFGTKAIAMAMKKPSLWGWAQKNQSVKPMVGGLVYRGPDLELQSEGGKVPSETAETYPLLQQIKNQLSREGIFRYADMFAFAEVLLERYPAMTAQISRRFPLVYLDEMQDTSWEQETILKRMFDDSVAMQRFGDVNQRILTGTGDVAKLSFPKADALPMSTSKRFGPAIAEVVSGVRVGGAAVVGTAVDVHPPMLMTYTTERVSHVLTHFGHQVLARFDDQALYHRHIKALCTRKQTEAQQLPGRTLLDYWPSYRDAPREGGRATLLWTLLGHAAQPGVEQSRCMRGQRMRSAQFYLCCALSNRRMSRGCGRRRSWFDA
ncbi:UvrD-helicase domain-containing protein [Roseateles chitinivorans]|uniref:UvrD-helicase domain-containing protein n=1 Tax=Roseateles chitinivorans TaxID=2917965 RepID=UPI003D66C6D6